MKSQRTRITASAVLMVALCAPSWAQDVTDSRRAGSPDVLAQAFLQQVQSGAVEVAFDTLLKGSPIAEQGQQYQMLKTQAQVTLPVMGRALGFERLDENRVGTSVVVVKYLMRHEKDAITWTFVFYRPVDRWMVTALKFLPTIQYL
jgi:hypothetical protein